MKLKIVLLSKVSTSRTKQLENMMSVFHTTSGIYIFSDVHSEKYTFEIENGNRKNEKEKRKKGKRTK